MISIRQKTDNVKEDIYMADKEIKFSALLVIRKIASYKHSNESLSPPKWPTLTEPTVPPVDTDMDMTNWNSHGCWECKSYHFGETKAK